MARVLVVDDSDSIRFLIRTNLEFAGFEVEEACDGEECLEALWAGAPLPDVVTLDVVMPRMDGISTLIALRADERTAVVPIVMVTTRAQTVDVKRATEAGANAYVTKPFEPSALVATIQDLVAST